LTTEDGMTERLDRLKELGETFWVRYGDGPVESRWPTQPGRYAVSSFSERYGENFWETFDAHDEVEQQIRDGGVDQIVDLDTGQEISYEVIVRVEWPTTDNRGQHERA
jgi:hypothetical protein